MRELGMKDIYYLSEILDKMDVDIDLNKLADKAKVSGDAQAYVGGQLMLLLLRKAYKAKNEVNAWLASLTGKTPDEISALKFTEMKSLLAEVSKLDGLNEVFQSAGADGN